MKKIIFLLFYIIVTISTLSAHPHMFVDMKLKAVFSENSFKGVYVDWLFDMVFTGLVLMDNGLVDPDLGWKSTFTEKEMDIIKSTYFESIANYNFYTYFNLNGKISKAKRFLDFSAYMKDNRLGYRFFLPYDGNDADAKEIRIAVYDKTFFVDISYVEENPVSIEASEGKVLDWTLSKNEDAPIFYDNTVQRVTREGASYTGQAFPVEFVIWLN